MDSRFMSRAIELARVGGGQGEIPVGAVIVKNGVIIGEGRNLREAQNRALSHAETEAIEAANRTLGDWRLDGCSLYVTLEPCLMCAGAIAAARISEVVFGAYDSGRGYIVSRADINQLAGSKITVFGGIKEDECKQLLDEFFKNIRQE